MTTKDEQCVGYCNGCVNKVVKGNLYHDIVDVECSVGISSSEMKAMGKIYKFPMGENHEGFLGWKLQKICDKFDSGHHMGKDAAEFRDVIVCNRNVKRKISSWDYYESDWRA